MLSPILVPRQWQGPRGVAHGGIVATYLDEVLETPLLGRAHATARHDLQP